MENLIKVQNSEIRSSGKFYVITTEKGTVLSDWREGERLVGDFPLKVGESYGIEWQWGGGQRQYRNIKYAYKEDDSTKLMEEL